MALCSPCDIMPDCANSRQAVQLAAALFSKWGRAFMALQMPWAGWLMRSTCKLYGPVLAVHPAGSTFQLDLHTIGCRADLEMMSG